MRNGQSCGWLTLVPQTVCNPNFVPSVNSYKKDGALLNKETTSLGLKFVKLVNIFLYCFEKQSHQTFIYLMVTKDVR